MRKCPEMSAKNIRPTFGTKRPRVRIPTLRPNPAEIRRFQPDFSAFSELFPIENFVTFPFDPNPTQTGIRSGKRRKREFAACRSTSGRRRSHFSLFSSYACHEAADFLRGFLSFYAGVFSRSESFCKRKSASKEFAAGPMPAAQKPPALAACMPASASSTTSAASGFTPRSFAAKRNTSGSGLEWVICVPSATASKKLPSPMRSRISGEFLLDDPTASL